MAAANSKGLRSLPRVNTSSRLHGNQYYFKLLPDKLQHSVQLHPEFRHCGWAGWPAGTVVRDRNPIYYMHDLF